MDQFLVGAIVAGYGVAGLFFLRFWRDSRDRLFAIFAAAFWLMGVAQVIFVLLARPDEHRPLLYTVRLVAFALILAAIGDKNRSRRPPD